MKHRILLGLLAMGLHGGAAVAQPTERKFESGGLIVQVNRATPPDGRSDFGLSLVVTNTQDATAEVFHTRDIQALSDTGNTYKDPRVGGLPVCLSATIDRCNDAVARSQLVPLSIDAKQSVTITLAFASGRRGAPGKTCSLDLSMPIYVRTVAGRAPGPWRLLTIGLPNIKVC